MRTSTRRVATQREIPLMDLELPESHRALQASLRDFCESKVKPYAREWDHDEKFPMEVVQGAGRAGRARHAGGRGVRRRRDGLPRGGGRRRGDRPLRRLARPHRGLATTASAPATSASSATTRSGSKYLPKLATGEWLGAWGLTEPGSGSDAAGMKTTAVRKGDNWVLNGAKMFITQGTVGDVFVVLARDRRRTKQQKGITAFILERGMQGFSQRAIHGKLGHALLGHRGADDGERGGPRLAAAGRGGPRLHRHAARSSTGAASPSARCRSGSARGALEESAAVRPRAHAPSASPSASSRPSAGCSRTCRPSSTRRACSCTARRVLADRGQPYAREASHGEAVRLRGRHARLQQGGADPRRLRLHPRVPRGALPARRQALRDRRGHERGAAHRHRPRAPQGLRPRCRWKRNGWRSSGSRCRRGRPAPRWCSRFSARS